MSLNLEKIKGIVDGSNEEVLLENANQNSETPSGMMYKLASETSKEFADQYLLSDDVLDAVRNNYIHIHDKDYMVTKSLTCLQHPLDKILKNGFRAGHGASRPAKRIETATMLACIAMETVQNEQHGGQAFPAFDFYLAPYVRKTFEEEYLKSCMLTGEEFDDDSIRAVVVDEYVVSDIYTYRGDIDPLKFAINQTVNRVHQAMESFIHNCNTIHSRGGNQVVFSSINYGTDTSPEGRCVIRELLKSTDRGVGNGETPIFPIQIFKLKTGVNVKPEDKNYDLFKLACKVTAKRFFPNFLNLDAPFNKHEKWDANDPERYKYEVATMGCRTRVFENRHGEKTSIGRGNLSFTTINLVKLALEAKQAHSVFDISTDFFRRLDKYVDLAVKQLVERYEYQRTALKKQFPMLMSGLWEGSEKLTSDQQVGDVLKQGTLSVGFIGLAEALITLTGEHHGESDTVQRIGLDIVEHIHNRVKKHADEHNLNISVIATPAEGLSGKFVKKDREQFGVIKNVTDRDYYTNSNHIPVWYKCSLSHKLEVEAAYHPYTLAGHIAYLEVDGNPENNLKAVKQMVELMLKHNVGYGSINHARARCLSCGYEDGTDLFDVCPKCSSTDVDVLERITGYLVGSVNKWNNAKKAELKDRVSHISGELILKGKNKI